MARQTSPPFWVIERYQYSALHFWCAFNGKSQWCTRIDDAARFADEESANQVLSHLADGNGRVAEHSYVAHDLP